MVSPPHAAPSLAVSEMDQPSGRLSSGQHTRAPRAMRKFQIGYLRPDGTPNWTDQIAPALPLFDSAFSAFCQGTLLQSPSGPVAVQDLEPGMLVSTADNGPARVLWIGAMTLVPAALGLEQSSCRLTRIMPDAFGFSRPESNLMVGPGARILSRPANLRDSFGTDRVLTPAADLVDGMNVIELVPPRPVTVYHLCLRRHSILRASGIEVESFHPGIGFERLLGPNMLSLFLSMFPHVKQPGDFGSTCHPRLPLPALAG